MAGKKRIFIAEDDMVMGMEMSEFFADSEYEVTGIADSGEKAVREVRASGPDLALIDIRLKGAMDGIQAAREIRRFSDIPIVFITGYKDSGTGEQAADITNTSFVSKPFDPHALVSALKKASGR